MALHSVCQLDPTLDRNTRLSVTCDYHEAGWFDTVRFLVKAGKYQHVAFINGKDLDEVFKIGNMGPEHRIFREKNRQMHSVSIGDVLFNIESEGDYTMYVVAPIGFLKV